MRRKGDTNTLRIVLYIVIFIVVIVAGFAHFFGIQKKQICQGTIRDEFTRLDNHIKGFARGYYFGEVYLDPNFETRDCVKCIFRNNDGKLQANFLGGGKIELDDVTENSYNLNFNGAGIQDGCDETEVKGDHVYKVLVKRSSDTDKLDVNFEGPL